MAVKTCCVTGHRDISIEQVGAIRNDLEKEILNAIDKGYTHFISGFAKGVDLIFADIVVKLKKEYDITLEAAIPYRGRMKTKDADFNRLIGCCNVVGIHSENYFNGCYMKRNKFMIDNSSLVIAVYDGRDIDGTAATVRYAKKKNNSIVVINTSNNDNI